MEQFRHAIATSGRYTHLFHFTDRRNLPGIREHGLLSLDRLRKSGIVPAAPGGNDWSHDADQRLGLHRYVHLCLMNQHPMEYVAKQEGRIEESVFLEVASVVLDLPGVLFSCDVSNKAGVETHPLARIDDFIDLEVVYQRTDGKLPDVQRRLQSMRKFEILVPDHVPARLLRMPANG